MKAPLSTDRVSAVYVSAPGTPGLRYTCPILQHGVWGCGICGAEAFSYEPIVGDECAECGAKVIGVRRGPPEPIYIPEHLR